MTNYILPLMNNGIVIQLVIVAASIVLGMLLYPRLIKTYSRFVTNLYKNLAKYRYFTEETKEAAVKEPAPKTEESSDRRSQIPSIIGKSKTKLGHDRTKTATTSENEKVIEKESTFASATGEEIVPMDDIDIPLEKVEIVSEEEFDADKETVGLEIEKGAILASGASYDELMNAGEIVTKKQPTDEEKDEAGRILHENRNTGLFEQMMAGSEKLSHSIASVIEFHLSRRAKEMTEPQTTDYPDDFGSFDINSIF